MTQESELTAKVDRLEQQSEGRPVRVILTVVDGEDGAAATIETVTAVLFDAGAHAVDPIDGTALLVVEAHPEALRAAAETGLVADVVLDELSPTQ
jgi:hypothetical protein